MRNACEFCLARGRTTGRRGAARCGRAVVLMVVVVLFDALPLALAPRPGLRSDDERAGKTRQKKRVDLLISMVRREKVLFFSRVTCEAFYTHSRKI